MNKRYFEIYVAGSNGFSAYVSTGKQIVNRLAGDDIEKRILELAVAAKVIEGGEGGDAKEIYNGAGYVEERQVAELPPHTAVTEI